MTGTLQSSLPTWMRRARRGVDWGVLLVLALGVALAWSFILLPGLPRTNASERYAFRAADYADALREGRLYPRWSPHVLGGYGAPIPNYYPPGAPYVAAVVDILFTDNPVNAVRVVYVLALAFSGVPVYTLVTRRTGARAGVLAAVLYLYAPPIGLSAPHVQGDLALVLGGVLLPSMLWAVDQLRLLNRTLDFALATGFSGALLLTDPRLGVFGLALAAALTVWERHGQCRRAFVFGALATGSTLAACFWLPALLEPVQWRVPLVPPPVLRLHTATLFAPPQPVDVGALVLTTPPALGIPLIAAGLFAIPVLTERNRKRGFFALFLVSGALTLVLGTAFFPTDIWLLTPAVLALAVGSSALMTVYFVRPLWRQGALPAALALLLWGALPVWMSPIWLPEFDDTSPLAQVRFEQQGFGVAVLPPDAALPVTLPDTLPASPFLLEGYQVGFLSRISPLQFRAAVQVSPLASTSHGDRAQLRIEQSVELEILRAYFPGWTALVNGESVPTRPDPASGLIRIGLLPSIGTELVLSLEPTPTRAAAWALTWGAALVAALVVWRRRHPEDYYENLELLSTADARLVALVLGGFVAALLLFAVPTSPLALRGQPGTALLDAAALRRSTDTGLQVLAFRLPDTRYQVGDSVSLTLYWRAARPLGRSYQTRLFLVRTGDENNRWFDTRLRVPGSYPTLRWLTNRYVTDAAALTIPPDATPGEYRIGVEVFDCTPQCGSDALNFFDERGSYLGRYFLLPTPISIRP